MSLLKAELYTPTYIIGKHYGMVFDISVSIPGTGCGAPFPVSLSGTLRALRVSSRVERTSANDCVYGVDRCSVQLAEYVKVLKA